MTHTVQVQPHPTDRGLSRWVCTCGWSTEWVLYTDQTAGPAAVRHQIQHQREDNQ